LLDRSVRKLGYVSAASLSPAKAEAPRGLVQASSLGNPPSSPFASKRGIRGGSVTVGGGSPRPFLRRASYAFGDRSNAGMISARTRTDEKSPEPMSFTRRPKRTSEATRAGSPLQNTRTTLEKVRAPTSETKTATETTIGDQHFCLEDMIGAGAFGIVFKAQERSGSSCAVKVTTATDTGSFAAATFEAELLQTLTAGLRDAFRAHVPFYIAHNASRRCPTTEGGTVSLAMSLCPGIALDRWLYGISDEEYKTVDVNQIVEGQLSGGQQGTRRLASAVETVRCLLLQLSGVLGALEPLAFHRDISAHNVLLDFQDANDASSAKRPVFALIDFGLAVQSETWIREWNNSNLAGDPRYWTPSAWMAFSFGFKHVTRHPNQGLQKQYLTMLDYFSMGILGLETLFTLWRKGEASESGCPGMLEVRNVWTKYWIQMVLIFQRFHREGAESVRKCLSHASINELMDSLRQLRQSLRNAAAMPHNRQYQSVLNVLAELIDEHGSISWAAIPTMLGGDVLHELTNECS